MVDRSKTEIAASIVSYNSDPGELSTILNSISMNSKSVSAIVVDNSPTDGLRALVEKYHADYLWHGRNLGFGAGHNVAFKRTLDSAKYHLAVNPDVAFGRDVIESLYQFMEEHPGVGLVMPQILY